MMLGAAGAVPALLSLPLGGLTDRVGLFKQVLVGSIISVAGYLGMGMARSAMVVVASFALAGLGNTTTMLCYQAFVAAIGSLEDRIQAFGWLTASVSLSQSLGPAVAGFVSDGWSLQAVFYLCAAFAATSLMGLSWVRGHRPAPKHSLESPAGADVPWWRNGGLLFAISSTLLFNIVVNIRASYLPLYFESIGRNRAQIGIWFSVHAAASLILRSRIGKLTERFGPWRMVEAAFAVTLVSLLVISGIHNYSLLLLLGIVLGMANGIVQPISMTVATDSVPATRQGMALGLRQSAQRLGQTISPFILGLSVSIGGLTGAFFGAAALAAAGIVAVRAVPDSGEHGYGHGSSKGSKEGD